jgi:hypothetical protein
MDQVKIKEQWAMLQGEYGGKLMLVRFNTGVKSLVGSKSYPFRIGIAIPFKKPQSNGLPSGEENLCFNQIEDEIGNFFNKEQRGFVCAIITTNGMKEYMNYSQSDDFSDLMSRLKQKFPEYVFQIYAARDENWEVYQKFVNK